MVVGVPFGLILLFVVGNLKFVRSIIEKSKLGSRAWKQGDVLCTAELCVGFLRMKESLVGGIFGWVEGSDF
jgi:hypothetical protein